MARAYLGSSRALAILLLLVGMAMVISTVARGGGPLALGVVVGVLFAALGAARLRLARGLGELGRSDSQSDSR